MRALLVVLAIPFVAVACGAEGESTDPGGNGSGKGSSSNGGATGAPSGSSSGEPTDPPAAGGATCAPMPACNGAAGPARGAKRDREHTTSSFVAASGGPHHRGRDAIYTAGEPQWIIGKFAYGMSDKDLKDEEVDVWLDRGCGGAWEKLGTTRTTEEGAHAIVEGVEDSGGRIYFEMPAGKELALGRHRVRLVVAGDHSSADLLIDVVAKSAPVIVSDVDGTLTSSETAEYPALLTGDLPEAQPDAAAVIRALVEKGYRPIYLTARPEWLTDRTKEFLATRGFPPGIVHTTTGLTGALGGAAAKFKSAELVLIGQKGLAIKWAFGNKASDTDAYHAANVQPVDQRVFLQVDDTHGGRRIEKYADVLAAAQATATACQ
jgi:phosphatidate phosphatase PAH1